MSAHVDFYQDESNEGEEGQWRWRLKAGNGEIVAAGEGHRDKTDARRAFLDMRDAVNEAFDGMKR
jgi:uncharacterized protein YegP (UPF0339 family)